MNTRRHLFAATAAVAALPLLPRPGAARAPLAGSQAPGFQRMRLGAFEVTALADGFIPMTPELFGAQAGDVAALVAATPQPNALRGHVNAYAVNTGERLVLIDTGGPASFVPTLGGFTASFRTAGFAPAQVDTILLTHLHVDHIGGLLDAGGRAAFPNAELVLAEAEHAFWSSPALLAGAPAGFRPLVEAAQAVLAAYAGRIRRFAGEADVVRGIAAVSLPGHTPGHTGFRIADGRAALLIWGDVVHAPAVQFAQPRITIAFDTDQAAARATRLGVLDRVVTERVAIAGMHLPFPGFGHVERRGEGFAFTPAWWSHDLG
jgi:glyoxylase-like metal-dependent hydrolase (beta-lactamase superfamily II)